jgi:hypothetical protein
MTVIDSAPKTKNVVGVDYDRLEAAAVSSETNYLFAMLEQAELQHHDALVELKENVCLQRRQFKVLQGGACLLKTSPGKA